MNFVGKFDAKLPVDGPVAHSAVHAHVDGASTHAPSDAIIVPDAQLLFGGDFKRSGVDLILSDNHHELVLHDYFKGEKRVALASPDGAHLTADLVNALAGHVEYAQADGAVAAAVVVGHVTKLTGTATAIRNGVSIILNQGDNVDKGDVLQSGSDSTLGVTFIDGTVFGLSSNARMVVNEMVYDPNGSNNSSLLSLVAGTISFVAGETAKHGDMKVDTPVATMGIRGTAVLVEIDFSVPGQNGAPSANFQVLMEPDGSTGSYILFDKNTLAPLATVNTAGTLTKISDGVVSFQAGTPLTADQQKLIFDLFTAKFGDNNTKLFDHFTDTVIPQPFMPIYLPGGVIATPLVLIATNSIGPPPAASGHSPGGVAHIPGDPLVAAFGNAVVEAPHVTGGHTPDTVTGQINFIDVNIGDQPTVQVQFSSFSYKDAHNNNIAASLTPQEQAAVAGIEGISVQANPGNLNNGSATWTYSFPDGAFDFLGAGETLTLTYTALVNNNYAQSPQTGTATFTITITGTNDVPVITSNVPQTIAFTGGTSVAGGDLTAHVPTSGTISFDDPDLTDTHTVSVKLLTTGLPPTPQQIFDNALTASIAADSTGTGFGTINWKLADLPVYLADFIPKGQTVTLTYAVTVTDSQGATATQDITVTITGTDTPAVVWISTTATGSAPGGLWSDGSNWETGTAPTATDDAIIITDQLIGLTPSYPVTIDAKTAAVAKSVTMNDFGTSPPELINLGTLTVGGAFDMSADSILHNSGTISVGGLMDVLDTSVLQNSGTLTLNGGGEFAGTSTITNTGTIEISGGTLTVEADVANAGGTVAVDGAGTLALDGGTIDRGTVNNSGTIDVTGSSEISDADLNNGHVAIASNARLILDNDTVTGTTFTGTDGTSIIQVDDGTTLNWSGVTINGGTINDGTAGGTGSIDVTGASTISGASLNNGSVTVGAAKLTLDNVTVTGTSFDETNGSIISVDIGDLLTLAGIVAITGVSGSSIANAGLIDVTGTTALTTDQLTNTGTGTLQVDGTLMLSGVSFSGGIIADNNLIDITGSSTISSASLNDGKVTLSGTTLKLDNDTVTGTTFEANAGGSVIEVDDGTTLKLSGVTIDGGTVNNGSAGGTGNIDITGASTISGADLNNGSVTVGDAKLTLDNVTVTGTSFNETASGSVLSVDADDKLILAGTDSITGVSGSSIANAGLIDVTGITTLTTDELTNTGTLQVDGTLHLSGATISGGTITDNNLIDVTSGSTINGGAALNGGQVKVEGVELTLDNVTVTGTSFNETSGSVISVDASDTLTLAGTDSVAGVPGSSIVNAGQIDVTGMLTLLGDLVTNSGIIQVDDGATLTLNGTDIVGGTVNDFSSAAGGTIDVTGESTISGAGLKDGHVTIAEGATLILDNATAVSGSALSIAGGGTLDVESGTNGPGATLDGVKITGVDAVTGNDATPASVIGVGVAGAATLTLDDGTSITGGTLTIGQFGVLDVVHGSAGTAVTLDVAVTNAGLLEASNGGTLDIDGSVNNSGTIEANGGTLVVGADASITGFATVTITNGGLAEFLGGSAQAPLALNATFSGSGILELDNSQHYGGTVSGFGASGTVDKIDLTDLAYSSSETDVWNSATHTLTISDGAHSSNIIFAGTYDQNSFALTSDADGHTEVVLSPAQASVSGLDSANNAVEGFAVVASLTDPNASVGITNQWLYNGGAISGATAPSYLPTANDLGKTLDVVVGFTDGSADHLTALAGTVATPPEVATNVDGIAVNENASLTLNTLNVSFGDAGSDSITVTLDVIHGTLALGSLAGVGESGSGTSLSPFILTGTLSAIDTALANGLVYTPTTGYYGPDMLTFEANDGTFHSNIAIAAIDVAPLPPVLNSMTLTIGQGGTDVLTNADFSVTDPNSSSFLYTVGDVIGGQFEVFNGENWVLAPTGCFTTAQIAVGHVEFVQDGSATAPNFSISASDGSSHTVSTAIAPTVNFTAAPLSFLPAYLEFNGHLAAVGPSVSDHAGNADSGTGSDAVTLQGWVDWNGHGGIGSSQLLFYNGSTSDVGFGLNGVVTANGFDLQIQHGGIGGTDTGITLAAGQWYDLAVTHSNGAFTVYVDGVAEFTDTEAVNGIGIEGHHRDHTLIGGNSVPGEGFHGSISDVSVWNTALTQSQIQADEFTALTGQESGLAGYFPLDDGGGRTVHDPTDHAGNLLLVRGTPVWQAASDSIANGASLGISSAFASHQGVVFQGSTGELTLDTPSSFHGKISGFTGNGTLSGSDQIDLKGINLNSGAFTDSYNATNDTLSVSDGTNSAVLHLNGIYQAANFSFTTDGNGGTIVYDPPVGGNSAAKAQAVAATNHGFVFNFAESGHDAANAQHPAADTHVFDGQLFANAEAIPNGLHDDGHGNAATPADGHDALAALGIKAQLHAHDFHFV